MRSLTRIKYAEARGIRDRARAIQLLNDGESELISLEYMHSVREAARTGQPGPSFEDVKESIKQSLASAISRYANANVEHVDRRDADSALCRGCSTQLAGSANFCPSCGLKRGG